MLNIVGGRETRYLWRGASGGPSPRPAVAVTWKHDPSWLVVVVLFISWMRRGTRPGVLQLC